MGPPDRRQSKRNASSQQEQSSSCHYKRPIRPKAISLMQSGDSEGRSPGQRTTAASMGLEVSKLEGSATSDEHYETSHPRFPVDFLQRTQGQHVCMYIQDKHIKIIDLDPRDLEKVNFMFTRARSEQAVPCRLIPRKGAGPDLRSKNGGKIDEYLMRLLRTGLAHADAPPLQQVRPPFHCKHARQ